MTSLYGQLLREPSDDAAVSVLRTLLEYSADVNLPDPGGNSPLLWAVAVGRKHMLPMLLEFGADPSLPNENAMTPLSYAASLSM